jgi:hypothetical protein
MVTENQEPTQQSLPEADAPPEEAAPEPQNPILSEIDKLNAAPEIDIDESPPDAEETEGEAAVPAEPVAEAPGAAPDVPQPSPEQMQQQAQQAQQAQQMQQVQAQAAEYERLRQQAAIQNETRSYQQQLESQGYAPEQAQQQATQYIQSRQAQQNLMGKADEYGQHLLGKMAASEHFAQKYKLSMEDLPVLRQAETPQIMEELAKRIADNHKTQAELTQLRKAQVPPQQYDSSQGEPQVASSDGGWLDRYNAGDRSANAVAAARRAVGME